MNNKNKKIKALEDQIDSQIAQEAYKEHLKNPKTYSFQEIKEMFNFDE